MKGIIIALVVLLVAAVIGLTIGLVNANQDLSIARAANTQLNAELSGAKEDLSKGIIIGRVFRENTNFGFLDERDSPHQGLIIHLKEANDGNFVGTVQTNFRGEYIFKVKPGKYSVEPQFWTEGYPPWKIILDLKHPDKMTVKEGEIVIGPTYLIR